MNPLIALLSHRPLPALVEALRVRTEQITRQWDGICRLAIPETSRLRYDELRDSVPKILAAIAEALESDDAESVQTLHQQAPVQGLTRYHQRYGPEQVLQEDAVLRAVIVVQCEEQLGRTLRATEAARCTH